MAQLLRELSALPEGLSSVPSNHMMTYHVLSWDLMPSSGMQVHIQTEHHLHKINLKKKKPRV